MPSPNLLANSGATIAGIFGRPIKEIPATEIIGRGLHIGETVVGEKIFPRSPANRTFSRLSGKNSAISEAPSRIVRFFVERNRGRLTLGSRLVVPRRAACGFFRLRLTHSRAGEGLG